MTYLGSQIVPKFIGLLCKGLNLFFIIRDCSMTCCQDQVELGPHRKLHSQNQCHKPAQREMGMPQGLCLTLGMESHQTMNQSLTPRGREMVRVIGGIGEII